VKYDYGFPLMAEIVPASEELKGDQEGFWIQHFNITEEEVQRARYSMDWTMRGLETGVYCVLHQRHNGWNRQWMSDTYLERSTNADFLREATGHVLILGLGIGMLPVALCRKEDVESVTVLEIEPQVIALVEPYIRHSKLAVIQADAFSPPLRGRHFDAVYVDVWENICSDNWETMKILQAIYRGLAKKGGLVTSWLRDYIKDEAKRARQEDWRYR